MSFLWVLALASCLATVESVDQSCPSNLPAYAKHFVKTTTEYCYSFFNTKKTYKDAESECKLYGGDLASIHSEEHNDFILELLRNTSGFYGYAWIGLTDSGSGSEDKFRWEDKTKLNYSKFGTNQGTNHTTTDITHYFEDCVVIDAKSGFWEDHRCENVLFGFIKSEESFICEFPIKPTLL